MRSISANGLATLAQRLGNEPIMIVEVDWRDGVQPKQYADRTITLPDGTVIPGAIIQIGNLDDAIDVTTWNNSSKQIEVTLDDTDGSIKALFDSYDITKRTVRLYQWFTGLAWSDRFVTFVGLINSPVSWSERDRTVKITVLSQIEDLECGFSAEEGNFPYIPADLVGKAWPQVFGLVYDYPALSLGAAVEGTLLQGVGIVTEYGTNTALNGAQPAYDPKSLAKLAQETIHAGFLLSVSFCWDFVDAATSQKYLNQANAIYAQIGQQEAGMVRAAACAQEKRVQQYDRAHQLLLGSGANPVQILGGEDFPQNQTVTLDIKGALFTGHFEGEWFYIESSNDPTATLAIENAWYNEWLDYSLNRDASRLPAGRVVEPRPLRGPRSVRLVLRRFRQSLHRHLRCDHDYHAERADACDPLHPQAVLGGRRARRSSCTRGSPTSPRSRRAPCWPSKPIAPTTAHGNWSC